MSVTKLFSRRIGSGLVEMLWGRRFGRRATASRRPMAMAIERLDTRVALAADSFAGSPQEFVSLGNLSLFSAQDKTAGRELWVSDGTATGTRVLKDVAPGKASSNPEGLTVVGSKVYFVADDGVNGRELWQTDGTTAGTSLVKDIHPGKETVFDWRLNKDVERNAWSDPQGLMAFGGKVFFAADDGVHGFELWSSDGTSQGTSMVKEIDPAPSSGAESMASNIPAFVVGGRLVVSAADGTWATDGTEAGTVLLSTTTLEQDWSLGGNKVSYARLGDRVVFAGTGDEGSEPWITDGTVAGTKILANIKPDSSGPSSDWSQPPAGFTTSGTTIFFFANDGEHGTELWRTDGTTSGTWLVRDIATGTHKDWQGQSVPDDSYPYGASMLPIAGGGILFTADDGATGAELWKSDGTAAGTALVKDLVPGSVKNPSAAWDGKARIPLSSYPGAFTAYKDAVYLTAKGGNQLWKTDGTAAGTVLVKDVDGPANGSGGSGGYGAMAVLNGQLLFGADSQSAGEGLWVSDGTQAGTVRVHDLAPRIVAVTPPDARMYITGDKISFRVEYTEPVTVTGKPAVPITIGTKSFAAAYESGSGSASLVFSYVVAKGLTDVDGIAAAASITAPAGATIRNAFRTAAKRDLPAMALAGVLVESVAPTVTSIAVPANGTFKAGDILAFVVTFSEGVVVTGTPSLKLTIGTGVRQATLVSQPSINTLRFEYQIVASDPNDLNGIALDKVIALGGGSIKDLHGNNAVLTLKVPSLAKVKVLQQQSS